MGSLLALSMIRLCHLLPAAPAPGMGFEKYSDVQIQRPLVRETWEHHLVQARRRIPKPVYKSSIRQPEVKMPGVLWTSKPLSKVVVPLLGDSKSSVVGDSTGTSDSVNRQQTVNFTVGEGATVQALSNRCETRDADMLIL